MKKGSSRNDIKFYKLLFYKKWHRKIQDSFFSNKFSLYKFLEFSKSSISIGEKKCEMLDREQKIYSHIWTTYWNNLIFCIKIALWKVSQNYKQPLRNLKSNFNFNWKFSRELHNEKFIKRLIIKSMISKIT